jgi:hypothetical protein
MKKHFLTGRHGSVAHAGAALLCITLLGLTGCGEDSLQSGENKIIAFTIDDVSGVIREVDQEIDIELPEGKDLSAVKPVITLSSSDASVSPVVDVEGVDLSRPTIFTVTAENGTTRSYVVKATKQAALTLQSIEVTPLKETYAYDEPFDEAADILVTGLYSDGSTKKESAKVEPAEGEEPAEGYTVDGYDPQKPGKQTLLVTLGGKADTFTITVSASVREKRVINISVDLPNTADEPEIFGIPEGGIELSAGKEDTIVISVGAAWYEIYSSIKWYVDGVDYTIDDDNTNIITINAVDDYALKIPHYITFIGTKGGFEYSRTIEFTVVQ